MIAFHVVDREIVHTQGTISIITLPYAEPVVPETFSDTERERSRPLQIKFRCKKKIEYDYDKLISFLLGVYFVFLCIVQCRENVK